MQINRFSYITPNELEGSVILRYTLAQNERLSAFYEGMFRNNAIDGLAPLSVSKTDEGCSLSFDVRGMLALSKLTANEIKRDCVLTILANIGKAVIGAQKFMLEERSFLLENSMIFVNIETLDVALVYDPTYNQHSYSYVEFARQWVMNGKFDLSEDSSYPAQLSDYINSMTQGDGIEQLHSYIAALRDTKPEPAPMPEQPVAAPAFEQPVAAPAFYAPPAQDDDDDNRTVFADMSSMQTPQPVQSQPEPAVPVAYLVDSIGSAVPINKEKFQIGKGKATATPNDLIIPNASVSRAHALIEFNGSDYSMIDLYSLNGTFVNGVRLLSNERRRINNGDVIVFAEVQYTFIIR